MIAGRAVRFQKAILTLLVGLASLPLSAASGSQQACLGQFRDELFVMRRQIPVDTAGGNPDDQQGFSVKVSEPTLSQQKQGIQAVIHRKWDSDWFSFHGSSPYDPQLDPRAPILILGTEVASVLGFEMPDEDTLLVPTADRSNQGIEHINMYLPKGRKIEGRFYTQTTMRQRPYIERYAGRMNPHKLVEVPLSTDPEIIPHDMNHVGFLLNEPVAFAYPKQLAEITLDVIDAAHEQLKLKSDIQPDEKQAIEADLKRLLSATTEKIDGASAFPAFVFAMPRPRSTPGYFRENMEALFNLHKGIPTPPHLLAGILQTEFMKQFLNAYISTHQADWTQRGYFPAGPSYNESSDLYQALTKRRAELRKAALQVLPR